MKRQPEPETEGLVLGIRLAEQKMQKKTFRGNSRDKSVSIRIHGDHSPDLVEISGKEFGIDKKTADAIEAAVSEAMGRAIENAKRAALRLLDEEL